MGHVTQTKDQERTPRGEKLIDFDSISRGKPDKEGDSVFKKEEVSSAQTKEVSV